MLLKAKTPFSYLLDSFDEFFAESWFPTTCVNIKNKTIPATNIKETDDEWKVELDVPGVKKENFNIKVEDNQLQIKYEEKDFDEDELNSYIKREFAYTGFTKTFILPEYANVNNITGKYKDGILSLIIPKNKKKLEEKVKRIEIE